MRGVRAPLYMQELLQSWVLSRGTAASRSASELWAAGREMGDGRLTDGGGQAEALEGVRDPRDMEAQDSGQEGRSDLEGRGVHHTYTLMLRPWHSWEAGREKTGPGFRGKYQFILPEGPWGPLL